MALGECCGEKAGKNWVARSAEGPLRLEGPRTQVRPDWATTVTHMQSRDMERHVPLSRRSNEQTSDHDAGRTTS